MQVRDDGRSEQGGGSGGGEEGSVVGCILKGEPVGFANRLDLRCERKKTKKPTVMVAR